MPNSSSQIIWSPYQRVSWANQYLGTEDSEPKATSTLLRSFVFVNYEYHQQIVNLAHFESKDQLHEFSRSIVKGGSKSQGRIVVVALDGDNSQRTFPPRQPMLNSQNDRAAVLAALETVDYVVVLDRLDLPLLIEKIKPDIFVDESGRSAGTAN